MNQQGNTYVRLQLWNRKGIQQYFKQCDVTDSFYVQDKLRI